MFNCGIIQCYVGTDCGYGGYTVHVYFSDWYTLMDFYIKTINKEDNVRTYICPSNRYIVSDRLKIPYLKLTRKPKYFFKYENIKYLDMFSGGYVYISLSIYNSMNYIKIMQKIKEYCYNNSFYVLDRNYDLAIFDGLDNNLLPIFKEIKTEGMF